MWLMIFIYQRETLGGAAVEGGYDGYVGAFGHVAEIDVGHVARGGLAVGQYADRVVYLDAEQGG